jgi:hypothetical protein
MTVNKVRMPTVRKVMHPVALSYASNSGAFLLTESDRLDVLYFKGR